MKGRSGVKILLIFIDMFRANLLNIWDCTKPKSNVDEVLEKWGGCAYTRCYTPAPDTPRSNGCLWSSVYPVKNGCNTRIRYPMHFLYQPRENFLRVLSDHGYKLNFVINPINENIGELPENFRGIAYYSDGKMLDKALDELQVTGDSITYISIEDYHMLVDDWRARPIAAEYADENIGRQLNLIDEKLNIRSFDYVVLFSDHGWTMSTEQYGTTIEQIGDNRCKILLFIRRRDDQYLTKDDRLCSIMDLGPTLADVCEINLHYQTDGKSLFDGKKHEFLLTEDHVDFNVSLSQAIEIWGILYRDGRKICRKSNGEWESNRETISEEEKEEANIIFKAYGSCYEENLNAGMIISRYRDLSKMTTYFDGTPRKVHTKLKTKVKEGLLRAMG